MPDKQEKLCCPCCKKEWLINSEQGRAILKRGKCIVCIAKADERIVMDPYEFRATAGG